MSTLLLRLAAPMQAWGAEAKFDRRTTQREPTKSGVTGLVAAALGRKRDESIDDIAALRFGVRADKPGVLLRDYHTAKSDKSAYVTNRYYLADAVFVAGLEGDDELLEKIDVALQRPMYPLFLGRRSCPPSGRVSLGIRRLLTVEQALESEPLQSQLSHDGHGLCFVEPPDQLLVHGLHALSLFSQFLIVAYRGGKRKGRNGFYPFLPDLSYSTVTLFARLRGLSMSQPRSSAV